MNIGICQNLIRGQREDWTNSQYCGAPTIDLGIPSERNICQACRQHSQRIITGVIEKWAAATRNDADWIETVEAIIVDMSARLVALRASRAPLSKIYRFQRDLDRRVALYRRVTESAA